MGSVLAAEVDPAAGVQSSSMLGAVPIAHVDSILAQPVQCIPHNTCPFCELGKVLIARSNCKASEHRLSVLKSLLEQSLV